MKEAKYVRNQWCCIIVLAVGALCHTVSSLRQDDPIGAEHEDWIDPLDPFSHDPTKVERDYNKYMDTKKKKEEVKSTEAAVNDAAKKPEETKSDENHPQKPSRPHCDHLCKKEKSIIERLEKELHKKPAPHMPYFKQYVAGIVRLVDKARQVSFHDASTFAMTVSLSDADLSTLRTFAMSEGEGTVQRAHSVLDGMYLSVLQVDIPEGTVTDWAGWISLVSWVVTSVSSAAIAICLLYRTGIPWSRFIGSTLVLLLSVSVPWTWYRLYLDEIVQRMASSSRPRPPDCDPESMTPWQRLQSSFSLTNQCEEYYKSLHIDPWVDVPPTKAIAVTLSKFLLEPLQHLGEGVSRMLVACLKDLPTHLWPVALGVLLFVFVMLLVMLFGYKVKLFYVFGLEPSTPAIQATDRRVLEGIERLNEQVLQLSEGSHTMRRLMDEQRRSLDEQLGQPVPLALPSIRPDEELPPARTTLPTAMSSVQPETLPLARTTLPTAMPSVQPLETLPPAHTTLPTSMPSVHPGDILPPPYSMPPEYTTFPPEDLPTRFVEQRPLPARVSGPRPIPVQPSAMTLDEDETDRVEEIEVETPPANQQPVNQQSLTQEMVLDQLVSQETFVKQPVQESDADAQCMTEIGVGEPHSVANLGAGDSIEDRQTFRSDVSMEPKTVSQVPAEQRCPKPSSFASLCHSVVAEAGVPGSLGDARGSESAVCSPPGVARVEELLRPTALDSSDDSDLEIIEEEPDQACG